MCDKAFREDYVQTLGFDVTVVPYGTYQVRYAWLFLFGGFLPLVLPPFGLCRFSDCTFGRLSSRTVLCLLSLSFVFARRVGCHHGAPFTGFSPRFLVCPLLEHGKYERDSIPDHCLGGHSNNFILFFLAWKS